MAVMLHVLLGLKTLENMYKNSSIAQVWNTRPRFWNITYLSYVQIFAWKSLDDAVAT